MERNDNKQLDRISYALGLSMGNNFRASGINEINVQDFADGVAAVFLGSQPKMTYDEAKAEIQAYFTELEKKQRAAAEETGRKNREAGEAFLAENGKRAGVKTTASGLQYEVLTEGSAPCHRQPTRWKCITPANSSTAQCSTLPSTGASPPLSALHR